jgi:hypothetical protein
MEVPAALTHRKPRYPMNKRLGGPQGRFGEEILLPLPGFEPRNIQPVPSRHTDCAITGS